MMQTVGLPRESAAAVYNAKLPAISGGAGRLGTEKARGDASALFFGDGRVRPGTFDERRRAGRDRANAVARAVDVERHLDTVGCRARRNRRIDRFVPNARQIGGRRVDDRAFDDVANERERNAERRDDFGVLRQAKRIPEFARCERNERGGSAAATDDRRMRTNEAVVGAQFIDRAAQLLARPIQHVRGQPFGSGSQCLRNAVEGQPRSRRIAAREGAVGDDVERVRSAGRGQRDTRSVRRDQRRDAGPLDCRRGDQRERRKRGVAHPGDMRRTRSDVDDTVRCSIRTSEPPAIASVRTSSVRSSVRYPPMRAGRICG